MKETFWVYILANKSNSTLYTGMTNNLERRLAEHRSGRIPGFSSRYNVHKLVYAQEYDSVITALEEEKRIKGGSRKKKEALIEKQNPEWSDLAPH